MWEVTINLYLWCHMHHYKPMKSNAMLLLFSFLAIGDSFWTQSIRFWRGQSTVTQAVYEVCSAIWDVMQSMYIAPAAENDWHIEHWFSTRWNFSNCLSALDGKHIIMGSPPNSNSMFHNYKGFFNHFNGLCGCWLPFCIWRCWPTMKQWRQWGIQSQLVWQELYEWRALQHCIVADEAFPLCIDLLRSLPKEKMSKDCLIQWQI